MDILLEAPQGQFKIRRLPFRQNELLQAWDAADEYLLNYLSKLETLDNVHVCILNDGFGALAVALHRHHPTAISDSYLSQQATRQNLELNGIDADKVCLLDSLTQPAKDIDFLLIKVPKTLALLEDQLYRLRPLLKVNTQVIAAGMIKNLPASVWQLLEKLLGQTTTSLAVKKARLIFSTVNEVKDLPENPYPGSYQLENTRFRIWNHANVFSREKLDIGSRFLLQHLPNNPAYHDVIDLGCGNGVVGLAIFNQNPAVNLKFVDESFMAIESARQNFKAAFGSLNQAEFLLNDGLKDFPLQSSDCIVCNPPFHQQHVIGAQIANQMFQQAHKVLRKGGELRVIGNRHLNYYVTLKSLFGNVTQIASNAKFNIISSIKA